MEYELQTFIKANGGVREAENYNAYRDRNKLDHFVLVLPNVDKLEPRRVVLNRRFTLTVGFKVIMFSITNKGVEASGMDDPAKYYDRRVLLYLRNQFATHALPALDADLPRGSKLRALKRWADIKGGSLDKMIDQALGL